MKHEAKSEALKKHLGNVICKTCGSKKHSTKECKSEKKERVDDNESEKEYNKREENGDQE